MENHTRIVLKEGMAFDVDVQGHSFRFDAASAFGGKDYGPSPKTLVLSALAGCSGMDVAAILRKMQMPFDSFAVEVDGVLTEEHPKVYSDIAVKYIFSGQNLDTEKIEKAVNLSLDKYCGVSAMLKKTAKITYEIIKNPG
jgi:putative redox protein